MNYVPLILAAVIVLGLGILVVFGDKKPRLIAGLLLLYAVIRILDSSLPDNALTTFIQSILRTLGDAFRTIQSPDSITSGLIALAVIGILIFVLVKGGPIARYIVGFVLIYMGLRALEVILFGNGFNELLRGMFETLASSLDQLSAQQP